jgi:hypothetical protein
MTVQVTWEHPRRAKVKKKTNESERQTGTSAETWFVYILRCADNSLYTGIREGPAVMDLGPSDLAPRVRLSGAYVSLRAAEMGRRAARMAGNSPPSKPIAAAQMTALTNSFGVTAKANAI